MALRASDMPMHLTAIRAGAGRGILPCFIADEDPLLERVAPPVPETCCEYWLIVHRDLRRAACVRAIMDWVQAPVEKRTRSPRRNPVNGGDFRPDPARKGRRAFLVLLIAAGKLL